MKKLIQILIIFGLIVMIGGTATGQPEEGNPEIVITVTNMKEPDQFEKECELSFDITNNGYGTLHTIIAWLTAWDDRGREVESVGGAAANTSRPIVLGATISGVEGAWFKEECKYLTELRFDGIDEIHCAMRMLPENVSCSKITILKSNVPSLKIKK